MPRCISSRCSYSMSPSTALRCRSRSACWRRSRSRCRHRLSSCVGDFARRPKWRDANDQNRRREARRAGNRQLPLRRRPLRGDGAAAGCRGVPLRDVQEDPRPYRRVRGNSQGRARSCRGARAQMVPIVGAGAARILRRVRRQRVLRSGAEGLHGDCRGHAGFADGVEDNRADPCGRARRTITGSTTASRSDWIDRRGRTSVVGSVRACWRSPSAPA